MTQRKITSIIAALGLTILLLTSVGAALASPTAPSISINGCSVTVSFTTDQAGVHRVYIADDFTNVFDQTVNAAAGERLTFSYTFDEIGTVIPGVGIYIEVDGSPVYENDFFTGLSSPCNGDTAAAASTLCVSHPAEATGALLVGTSLFYWDNDLEKYSQGRETLNPGDTVLVVGIDEAEEFYRVIFACGAYWVPVEVLAPNPDDVWRSRPLSNRLIEDGS